MKSPKEIRERFEKYATSIYIIEWENDTLFPFRSEHYHDKKTDMIKFFDSKSEALTLIEKDFTTGKEKIIKRKE